MNSYINNHHTSSVVAPVIKDRDLCGVSCAESTSILLESPSCTLRNNPGRAVGKVATGVNIQSIGCWNIRTLADNSRSSCPERKTALLAKEFHRYGLGIIALSETRNEGQGHMVEKLPEATYHFHWSGKPPEDRRESGVGFAIKDSIAKHLVDSPVGHNDRIMSMRLNIGRSRHLTIVSVYAPTMQSDQGIKERFYEQLRCVLNKVQQSDKLILLGDFNARV
ncbi:MAG: endonuclease/exonuclease/phosphatase family protein [Pseudomonadota bacterium]